MWRNHSDIRYRKWAGPSTSCTQFSPKYNVFVGNLLLPVANSGAELMSLTFSSGCVTTCCSHRLAFLGHLARDRALGSAYELVGTTLNPQKPLHQHENNRCSSDYGDLRVISFLPPLLLLLPLLNLLLANDLPMAMNHLGRAIWTLGKGRQEARTGEEGWEKQNVPGFPTYPRIVVGSRQDPST